MKRRAFLRTVVLASLVGFIDVEKLAPEQKLYGRSYVEVLEEEQRILNRLLDHRFDALRYSTRELVGR